MKLTPYRSTVVLSVVLLAVATGCQRRVEQPRETSTPPSEATQSATATTEPSAAADATAQQAQGETAEPVSEQELAQREAAVAQREQAVAQREAAVSRRASGAAPSKQTGTSEPTPTESQPQVAQSAPASDESWRERRAEREVSLSVPAGTTFDIELTDGVSSESAQVGDAFSARTVHDLTDNGMVAVPAGSRIEGEVSAVQPLKKIGGQAQLSLTFHRIVLPDGTSVPIQASFATAGKSETKRDAGTIAGGAAAGAILGRIIDKKHRDKNTVLGALVGAAVGTAIASKTEGEAVELPAGAVVTLSLDQSLNVTRRVPAD